MRVILFRFVLSASFLIFSSVGCEEKPQRALPLPDAGVDAATTQEDLTDTSSYARSLLPRPVSFYTREQPPNGSDVLPAGLTPEDRAVGTLVGLAVGDAVGVALEFEPRDAKNIVDMVGNPTLYGGVQAGEFTDDTSMALCLGASLLAQGKLDPHDAMERWVRWMEQGYFSARQDGKPAFDIGGTTHSMLLAYKANPKDPYPGKSDVRAIPTNGAIMRLAPIPIFWHKHRKQATERAAEQGLTTHGAAGSVDATRVLAHMLVLAIHGASKQDVLHAKGFDPRQWKAGDLIQKMFQPQASWRGKKRSELQHPYIGSAEFTLECALWSILKTDNYQDAVLMVANLGGDADTTGAVTGQIAGALYGVQNIPQSWRKKMTLGAEIDKMARDLFARAP